MTFRAYAFDASTGTLTRILGAPVGTPVEKVVFLSNKAFNIDWMWSNNISGSANSRPTNIKIGQKTYTSGWFAMCREPGASANFKVSKGSKSGTDAVSFTGVPGWTPEQNAGLDGRVIVHKPGLMPLPIDVRSFAIGAVTGVAVAAVAFFAWYNLVSMG